MTWWAMVEKDKRTSRLVTPDSERITMYDDTQPPAVQRSAARSMLPSESNPTTGVPQDAETPTHRGSTPPYRLGLVAWNALPAVVPSAGGRIGGLETGAWTLARALAAESEVVPELFLRAGWRRVPRRVDEVALHVAREPLSEVRRQVGDCVALARPPKLRRWRSRLLWQLPLLALARPWRPPPRPRRAPDPRLADARVDVWAGFGVNSESARVAATAHQQSKPMLLFLESNADLDPGVLEPGERFNAYGESSLDQRFAIERASCIACQSEFQMQQLRRHFGREGVLIRNPIDVQRWRTGGTTARTKILWVGRYDSFHKRPALALDIARRCPHLQFEMIVNTGDPNVEAAIRGRAPANVELIDYVPFDEMPRRFATARAFLCTGSAAHEGFPNVLLQAAASHTPVCSLEDFDGFIARSGCGEVHPDPGEAAKYLQRLNAGATLDWSPVDRYLQSHHSPAAIAANTARLVEQLCQRVAS
jgi:glycosyltransferase involved in cell wall biosynthesis